MKRLKRTLPGIEPLDLSFNQAVSITRQWGHGCCRSFQIKPQQVAAGAYEVVNGKGWK